MGILGIFREEWTLLEILHLFLTAFSVAQLFDCFNTFRAQQKFIKNNKTTERIKERGNKVLLGSVLNLIDTRLGKIGFYILTWLLGLTVYAALLWATPNIVNEISSVISIVSFVSWLVISNRNNRIVIKIEEAKTNIPR